MISFSHSGLLFRTSRNAACYSCIIITSLKSESLYYSNLASMICIFMSFAVWTTVHCTRTHNQPQDCERQDPDLSPLDRAFVVHMSLWFFGRIGWRTMLILGNWGIGFHSEDDEPSSQNSASPSRLVSHTRWPCPSKTRPHAHISGSGKESEWSSNLGHEDR